jgi:hypothetical protein
MWGLYCRSALFIFDKTGSFGGNLWIYGRRYSDDMEHMIKTLLSERLFLMWCDNKRGVKLNR